MWIIFLEIAVALGLVAVVLWATWPRRRQDSDDEPPPA